MGIRSDKAVYEACILGVNKHQVTKNARKTEHNNSFTLTSIDGNNNSDTQMNKDLSSKKCNMVTYSTKQIRSRTANPLNKNINTDLITFYQNIRGLHSKVDEMFNFWSLELPHILCLIEHHLHDHEINSTHINCYTLGAKYCRKSRNLSFADIIRSSPYIPH
jgi:hypothetical protein